MTARDFADSQTVFHGSLIYQHSKSYLKNCEYEDWEIPPFVWRGNTLLVNPASYYEWLLDRGLISKEPRIPADEVDPCS